MTRVWLLGGGAFIVSCTLLNPLDELENGPPLDAALDTTDGVFDAATNDAGVESKYRAAVMADEPLGYWRLGEKSGTVAKDEVGQHDGTYTGDVVLGVGTAAADGDTAVTFDGKTAHVVVGDALGFTGKASFSVEAWINVPQAERTLRYVVSKFSQDAGAGWYVSENKQYDGLGFGVMNFGLWSEWAIPFVAKVWLHYVGTYSPTELCAYLNGNLMHCFEPGNTPSDTSAALVIGASAGGDGLFEGSIDEVAVYDHVLPLERIKAHFDAR